MLLAVRSLDVVYDDVSPVLRGVSVSVPQGAIVALLGANGAGKTTLLRAISGLLAIRRGKITNGSVELGKLDITRRDAPSIVRAGVAQVMEGRRIFAELTVDENLRAGAFSCRSRREVGERRDEMLELFPALARYLRQTAGLLSGGEQQMLAIARALMARPRLLLLDEPSHGLAPRTVERLRDIIVAVNRRGTSVLLVEQKARMALEIAEYGYLLKSGEVAREAPAAELLADRDIRAVYMGLAGPDRHSSPGTGTTGRRPERPA
jgi:branched-chain amino acid transport system ATP-binding protein